MLNLFFLPTSSAIFLELNGISGLVQFHIKIPFVRLEAREKKKRINIESNLITLERNSRKTNVGAATSEAFGAAITASSVAM